MLGNLLKCLICCEFKSLVQFLDQCHQGSKGIAHLAAVSLADSDLGFGLIV
jgi:hypothetical protein